MTHVVFCVQQILTAAHMGVTGNERIPTPAQTIPYLFLDVDDVPHGPRVKQGHERTAVIEERLPVLRRIMTSRGVPDAAVGDVPLTRGPEASWAPSRA
ncbi:hypothetical protein [Microbacterium sp. NPDC077184]|uniref:hypothetical protein n=1 Tax=Microbacterium sp. NPDC077184 TaxID=3154764 RepID=UPI00344444E7